MLQRCPSWRARRADARALAERPAPLVAGAARGIPGASLRESSASRPAGTRALARTPLLRGDRRVLRALRPVLLRSGSRDARAPGLRADRAALPRASADAELHRLEPLELEAVVLPGAREARRHETAREHEFTGAQPGAVPCQVARDPREHEQRIA